MNRNNLLKEYKGRLEKSITDTQAVLTDPSKSIDAISKIKREIDLVDQGLKEKTFRDYKALGKFLSENYGRMLTLETISGKEITFMLDVSDVHVPEALRNFSKKFEVHEESEPAVLNQTGIYLTPPHGELIWKGKKTALVKSIRLNRYLETPLYLLSGKLCYGVIRIEGPKEINLNDFKGLSGKHQITEEERKKWWPGKEILYYYPVNLIRRWNPPREWKVQKGAQSFVKNVEFEENSEVARFIFLSREESEANEGDTREESIQKEMTLYGDWYKVGPDPKKEYRYVAQHHIRGDSVHTDLRMEVNDHLIGWTLDTPGSVKTLKHDKFLNPVTPSQKTDYQNLAERKLIQPKVWLTVKGKIPAGGIGATKYKEAEFVIVSSGTVKFGTQKHDFHEYFLVPEKKWNQDSSVKGRWIAAYIPRPAHYERAGEGKMMWAFWKPNDEKPYVETQDHEESVKKAENEKGYLVWRDPEKGELQPQKDFRKEKKQSWVYK